MIYSKYNTIYIYNIYMYIYIIYIYIYIYTLWVVCLSIHQWELNSVIKQSGFMVVSIKMNVVYECIISSIEFI